MERAPKRLSRMLLLLLCRLPQSVRCWNRTTRRQLDEQQQPNGVHTVPRWCVRVCERLRAAVLMNDCATGLYGRILLGGRQGGEVPAVSTWHPSLPAAPPHPDLSLTSAVRLRFLHACAQRHAQACEVCCNALPARRSTFGFVTRFLLACAWTFRLHQLRQVRCDAMQCDAMQCGAGGAIRCAVWAMPTRSCTVSPVAVFVRKGRSDTSKFSAQSTKALASARQVCSIAASLAFPSKRTHAE